MKHNSITSRQTQSEMEKIKNEFEDWRENKTQNRIPEYLWKAAIQLYPKYSMYEISKVLRLNYGRLKRYILNATLEKKTESAEKTSNSVVPIEISTHIKENQSEIEKVSKQFENWRKNKTQKKIPEYLWKAAIQLYPKYSITKIAAVLGLTYVKLKRLILEATLETKTEGTKKKTDSVTQTKPITSSKDKQSKMEKVQQQLEPPSFIQWKIPGQSVQNEWTIEIENVDGAKIKISGKALEPPDFISICQNFSRSNL